jgi:hypothetical protein
VKRRVRLVLAVVAFVAPRGIRRFVLTRLLGHRIHPTAQVGHSLILVDRLEMGPGSSIGHLNLLRNLERVVLEEDALIGFLNWANAVRRAPDQFPGLERRLELILRRNATITALHLLDCCDTVEVGELASIGGWFSQVMTHAADLEAGRQSTAPVLIGERSLIGTRAVIVPGVEIADRVFVGAGSVVTRSLPKSAALYAGVPAVFKRDIDPEAGYFTRPGGRVP